jgi:uncharacterized membrane protein
MKNKNKTLTIKISLIAVFTALICVTTMVINFPIVNTDGFINVGDSIIFVCAIMLNPLSAFICGGLGSAFADLFLGYIHWAPFTFIIKGLEGLICSVLYKILIKKIKIKFIFTIILSTLTAAIFMVAGYFGVSIIYYGLYNAYVSSLPNLVQGGLSIIIAIILLLPFKRSGLIAYVEGLIFKRKENKDDQSEISETTNNDIK